MVKMKTIVIVSSVILLLLFVILCILLSNVNPPAKPVDKLSEDSDFFFNSNDVIIPNDNIGLGLEKVYDASEAGKSLSKKINVTLLKSVQKKNKDPDNKKRINNTTISDKTTVHKKEISLKKSDIRRSIKEDKLLKQKSSPKALLFNITGVDGQPGIEIKIISDKLTSKKSRKYRSSGIKMKTTSNSSSKLDADNSIQEAYLVMAENGTLILKVFANLIYVLGENETVPYYRFEDSYEEIDSNSIEHQENKTYDTDMRNEMENVNKSSDTNMYTYLTNYYLTNTDMSLTQSNITESTLSSENNMNENISTRILNSEKDQSARRDRYLKLQQEESLRNQTVTQEIDIISLSNVDFHKQTTQFATGIVDTVNEDNANTSLSTLGSFDSSSHG